MKTKIEQLYGRRAASALTRSAASWAANLGQSEESINAATLAATETVARSYAGAANITLTQARRAVAALVRAVGRVDSHDIVHVRMELGYGAIGDARGAWPILRAYTRSLRASKPVTYSAALGETLISASEDHALHAIGYATPKAWNERIANGALDAVLSGSRTPQQRWLATR